MKSASKDVNKDVNVHHPLEQGSPGGSYTWHGGAGTSVTSACLDLDQLPQTPPIWPHPELPIKGEGEHKVPAQSSSLLSTWSLHSPAGMVGFLCPGQSKELRLPGTWRVSHAHTFSSSSSLLLFWFFLSSPVPPPYLPSLTPLTPPPPPLPPPPLAPHPTLPLLQLMHFLLPLPPPAPLLPPALPPPPPSGISHSMRM